MKLDKWLEELEQITSAAVNYDIMYDEVYWIFGDDKVLKYATVLYDEIPVWQPVTYDECGAYVEVRGEKEYLLEITEE